jgi:CSLREA domain-containing protein
MMPRMTLLTTNNATWVQRARSIPFWLLALLVASSVAMLVEAKPAHADSFTVNSTGDAKDANIGNRTCDSSSRAGRQCTLRAAIQESNANDNDPRVVDLIRFDVGRAASVKTISPTSPLPTIRDAVTVNGYTQSGARANTRARGNNAIIKVQLDGTDAGESANGLEIAAPDCTIKGLAINRFWQGGILLDGRRAKRNRVQGNFIGTNATGTQALGNHSDGVIIDDADENTVGGTATEARNLISANGDDGVGFSGVDFSGKGAAHNRVQGNYIGTDKNGTADLGIDGDGVTFSGAHADKNTIGGTDRWGGQRDLRQRRRRR